ncbi:BrnT family toxin [Rhodopseudomonas palustris]|uniref:BrnT family toxin n=1 Tax=Rhodopseudomonas palustris TaxID=1076 RepID=A0A418V3N3_RHOPL|nr:BrnT family toxin [Rhodopseudomonas palustris]RJF70695.1 BrnT family toxin [Rhodopseudomonas palustris]
MDVAGFDWDHGNRAKCEKHGVTRGEIESLFRGPVSVFPDPVHSQTEQRFKAIGRSEAGRMVFLIFTLRRDSGETLIRPISARYMHRKEVAYYEKEAARTEK